MSVKYSKLPTSDTSSELLFDYSSPFSYDSDVDVSYKYRSAFTYSSIQKKQPYSDLDCETSQLSLSGRILDRVLICIFIIVLILTFPISIWFSFKRVPNFQKMVIFRLGKLIGSKGPGMIFIIPFMDRCHKVDVRIKAFNVPPKQIITGDGAAVEVGADVHYRISDVEKSITCVQNLDQSTRILVQATLMNLLVKRNLAQIETQRNALGKAVQESSNEASREWGVDICRIELSQVKVLRGPPPKQTPSVMFPPGMMSSSPTSGGTTSLPPAFQQIASALMAAQGDTSNQTIIPPSSESLSNVKEKLSCSSVTPATILNTVKSVLTESLVQKVDAVYQFQITGEDGGLYYLDLKHGRGATGEGMSPSGESDTTLMLTLDDLQAMFTGQLKPFQAYMSGRLQAAGDLDAAMRLEEVINKITGRS